MVNVDMDIFKIAAGNPGGLAFICEAIKEYPISESGG